MTWSRDRFEAKIDIRTHEECWEWQGSRDEGRYGRLFWNGKSTRAHRVALEIELGRPLGLRMEAAHKCDNPPCCNPQHLWEATHQENMLDSHAKERSHTVIQTQDALAKQRRNTPRGEGHWMKKKEARLAHLGSANANSKLTWGQVREIRSLRAEGKLLREIAPLFGISLVLVSQIVRGLIWDEDGYERRAQKPKRPLSPEKATEIRRRYAQGGVTQKVLAAEYGVSQHNIYGILKGFIYRQHG